VGFAQVGFALVGCRATRLTAGPAAPDTCATVHVPCVCVCVFDSVCVFGSMHGTSKWLAALRRASCGLPTHRLRCRRQATRRLQQVVDFLRDKHDQVCCSASTRLRLEGECDSPHPARFAPRLGSPLPHLHRDWAHPATSVPGLGSPLPAHIRTGTAGQVSGVSRSLKQSSGLYEHFTAQLEQSHPGVRPVQVQVWQGCPSADVAGVSPFPVQQRCGSGALVQSVSARGPSRWQSYTRFSRF
jgi:hypothetical protein